MNDCIDQLEIYTIFYTLKIYICVKFEEFWISERWENRENSNREPLLENSQVPKTQGIVKLPESFSLVGILHEMIELQVFESGTVWFSSQFLL